MFLISILKAILDLKTIVISVKELVKFIKKIGLLRPQILILFALIFVAIFFLLQQIYSINDDIYKGTLRKIEIENRIDETLRQCGDKTSVSVSTVTIIPPEGDEGRKSNFLYARACDFRSKDNSCIIDLRSLKPKVYNANYNIKSNTYALLINIGLDANPRFFSLQKDGVQNLESVNQYPSIVDILRLTDWYSEGNLNDLWITSILDKRESVLYVITFISGKPNTDGKCFSSLLVNLKRVITK